MAAHVLRGRELLFLSRGATEPLFRSRPLPHLAIQPGKLLLQGADALLRLGMRHAPLAVLLLGARVRLGDARQLREPAGHALEVALDPEMMGCRRMEQAPDAGVLHAKGLQLLSADF